MKKQILALVLALAALSLAQAPPASAAAPGSLIKGSSSTAVYYYAEDGKRHVFPTDKIYFSWYADFSGVTTISDADLAGIMLGSNVTYHPGVRLVKVQTDPKVYAIGPGGALRWIASESVALSLYGADWSKQVDDIPDAFFVNYHEDAVIQSAADFDLNAARGVSSINEDLSKHALAGSPASGGSSSGTPTTPLVTPPPAPVVNSNNLILNASVETASSASPSMPASWVHTSSPGSKASFSYPALGQDGLAAVQVTVSSYVSGSGAKWYFDPVTVLPGADYEFSDYYTSTANTEVTMKFLLDDGRTKYLDLLKLSPAAAWTKTRNTFAAPAHAVSVTALHLIQNDGTLTTDNYSLKKLPPGTLSAGMISLSFDDGLISAYQNAIPLLDAVGIKSSQYLVTQSIGDSGYVDEQEVKAMQASGHEIGAHTRTHPKLSELTQTAMVAEVAGSKSDLAALGMDPVTFVYPYDDFNDAVEQAVRDAGYRGARTTREGFNDKNTNPFELKDQHVESTTTFAQIQGWIDQAKADKTWLILELHNVDHNGLQYSTTPEIFQQAVAYIKTSGISVVTLAEGLTVLGH